MSQGNESAAVTEFFIVGFPGLAPKYYDLMAAAFFIIYVTSVAWNVLLIVLFVIQPSLQKPMYIIVVSLALSDTGFCTVALPKIIAKYWFGAGTISFHVCMFQRQLIHYFGTLNSVILLIVALDRYLAICFPLRYPVLMTNRIMGLLNGCAWVSSMIAPSISTIQSSRMSFCRSNKIVHCYCDAISIRSLACGDISTEANSSLVVSTFVLLVPFSLIMLSYVHIVVAVLRLTSKQSRLKMVSTCLTQVSIIGIYYIPRLFIYIANPIPSFKLDADTRIAVTMFYSLLPPVVNPLIYCFRTKEIKGVLCKWIHQNNLFSQKPTIVSVSD